jgi:hypothetical protein
VTPFDLVLAVAGWLASSIQRLARGSRRAVWVIVICLVALSAIPTAIIGSSQRPTDLTFEDVRLDRIPAMTKWVRLEGELRGSSSPGGEGYELHDTADDGSYVIVIAPTAMPIGHTVVTGQLSPGGGDADGNIGTIEIDVPAVPKANEPFGLILLPAIVGLFVALGIRTGYPIVRRERSSRARSTPLAPLTPRERTVARWSGRIGGETVAIDDARPTTIAISTEPDLSDIALTDTHGVHTVRVRRPGLPQAVRVCRVGGCEPGAEIHAHSADVVLTFDDRPTRDRFAATLR